MVHIDKVSIYETRRLIKQIIIWLKIEDISILELVFNFDFIFDYESHIAKRKREILLQNKPIMIISIEPVTFLKFGPFQLELFDVLIIECLNWAFLIGKEDFPINEDVRVAVIVPGNLVVFW